MKATFPKALFVLLPIAAWAADDIKPLDVKPGLWEITTKMDMGGRAMTMPQIPPETMQRMPPEQRAKLEGMMKGRNSGGGTTTKSCLTKEQIAQGPNLGDAQKNCTRNVISSSSSKLVMHLECTQADTKSSGEVTFERIDSEHARGNMTMKVVSGGNPGMDMKVNIESKFLSSDCGDVKPGTAK